MVFICVNPRHLRGHPLALSFGSPALSMQDCRRNDGSSVPRLMPSAQAAQKSTNSHIGYSAFSDFQKAARLCGEIGILDFIESLSNGIQTTMVEGGNNLSGGQRQRLAIVRAFYSDPPIILMDEPSSALDRKSEQKLINRLVKLKQAGKIIVISAHSTRYEKIADKIVTMEAGKIISDAPPSPPLAQTVHPPQPMETTMLTQTG